MEEGRAGIGADEDGVELERLRVLLCIPKDQIAAIHQDVCGRIYKMVRA